MFTACIPSSIGMIRITEDGGAITRLDWRQEAEAKPPETDLLKEACAQIDAYFAGTRTTFELPLAPEGNGFQHEVCEAMFAIPFGETRTYGQLATALGNSAQAVGNACGANPIPLIIPCHRVVGTGNLGGFSGNGGVETKVQLLRHEGAFGLLI
jgi:methylated-DNA-[protein]-cysteine S-methyltransferase